MKPLFQLIFIIWPLRYVALVVAAALFVYLQWEYEPKYSESKFNVYSSQDLKTWIHYSELPMKIGTSNYDLEINPEGSRKSFKVGVSNSLGEIFIQ